MLSALHVRQNDHRITTAQRVGPLMNDVQSQGYFSIESTQPIEIRFEKLCSLPSVFQSAWDRIGLLISIGISKSVSPLDEPHSFFSLRLQLDSHILHNSKQLSVKLHYRNNE